MGWHTSSWTHKRICIACLKETNHVEKETTNPNTGANATWYADCENFHYRVCNQDVTCNKLSVVSDSNVPVACVFKEEHRENENREMSFAEQPVIQQEDNNKIDVLE